MCSVTESWIEPLNAQLSELDLAIEDQLGQIAAVKSTILHHDLRIAKLLGSVTKSWSHCTILLVYTAEIVCLMRFQNIVVQTAEI